MKNLEHFIDVYINEKDKAKPAKTKFFSKSLTENIEFFKRKFSQSADFSLKYLNLGQTPCAIISIAGMISKDTLTQSVLLPIINFDIKGNKRLRRHCN